MKELEKKGWQWVEFGVGKTLHASAPDYHVHTHARQALILYTHPYAQRIMGNPMVTRIEITLRKYKDK